MPARADRKEQMRPMEKPIRTIRMLETAQAVFTGGYWMDRGNKIITKIRGISASSNFVRYYTFMSSFTPMVCENTIEKFSTVLK